MNGRAYPSVREAIHATATRGTVPMKALASDLDWSPSELSMRTTLGDDNARSFPADDDHLVKMMERTDDDSILMTLAAKRGYELLPKRDRVPEMVEQLRSDLKIFHGKVQLLLEMPGLAPASRKR